MGREELYQLSYVNPNGEPTELIIQVALLRNSGLVPSTTSIPLSGYVACIHYIQHMLTHIVDIPYSYNSWRLKDLKDELKQK